MTLKKPEMIIFDYGHTLVYEPDYSHLRGIGAVMEHVTENPRGYTPEQVCQTMFELSDSCKRWNYDNGSRAEVHHLIFSRFLFEYLELKLDITYSEAEWIYWDCAAHASAMPHINETIKYINSLNIRTAVISNITFSESALKRRIDQYVPDNNFKFIIASSEYVFRKPNPHIFKLALVKAGLSADKCWYCGDNCIADIAGACSVGIFPVWYNSSLDCFYRTSEENAKPECNHLCITDWQQLDEILKNA